LSFLLDTDVVRMGEAANQSHVVTWLQEVEEERVFLSVASLVEIRRGVELMAAGQHRDRLAAWLSEDLRLQLEQH
jgi:predicted nucleic acid-binding protein